MNQHRFSFRVTALVVLLSLMMGVFAARLYAVQVVEGAEQESALPGSYTYLTRVTAARGEILFYKVIDEILIFDRSDIFHASSSFCVCIN